MRRVKLLFKSRAFYSSFMLMLAYMIYSMLFDRIILFKGKTLEYTFFFLISLLPLVLSVFAILISFTDMSFLKFLKGVKSGNSNVYDEIVLYFKLNSGVILFAIFWNFILLCFGIGEYKLYGYPIYQYLTSFVFTYAVVSFIILVFFIFNFARQKAEYVELKNYIDDKNKTK